jgi:hypothetical protein
MSVSTLLAAPSTAGEANGVPVAQDGPISYSIDTGLGVVFIDLLEADDAPALVQALQRIRLDSAFDPAFHACVDCRHLSSVPGPSGLRVIAALILHAVTGDLSGRLAIVARSAAALASARLFATLTRIPSERLRILRTHNDGLVWLKLDADNVESDRGATNIIVTPSAWVMRAQATGQLAMKPEC